MRTAILVVVLLAGCTSPTPAGDAPPEDPGSTVPPEERVILARHLPLNTTATYRHTLLNQTSHISVGFASGPSLLTSDGDVVATIALTTNHTIGNTGGLRSPGPGATFYLDAETMEFIGHRMNGPEEGGFGQATYRLIERGPREARWLPRHDPWVAALFADEEHDWPRHGVVVERSGQTVVAKGPSGSCWTAARPAGSGWPDTMRFAATTSGPCTFDARTVDLALVAVAPGADPPRPDEDPAPLAWQGTQDTWETHETPTGQVLHHPGALLSAPGAASILQAFGTQLALHSQATQFILKSHEWHRDFAPIVTEDGQPYEPLPEWDGMTRMSAVAAAGDVDRETVTASWLMQEVEGQLALIPLDATVVAVTLVFADVPLQPPLASPEPFLASAYEAMGRGPDQLVYRLSAPGHRHQTHLWSAAFGCAPNDADEATVLRFDADAGDIAAYFWKRPYAGVSACNAGISSIG